MYQSIITEVDHGVGILTLNRGERHNALDRAMVTELIDALGTLEVNPAVRVVVLSAAGKSFCAGIDPAWVRETLECTAEKNLQDNRDLARLLSTLSGIGKPTLARVHGPAHGIGIGLVAACDIAFTTYDASFALHEVKHGQLPAIACPYLIAAVGERHARYYMLTGERFSGTEAYRIGLVHEMVPDDVQLDEAISETVDHLLKSGPNAMGASKALLRVVSGKPIDSTTIEETAQSATFIQGSGEGREGMLAQVNKRKPSWSA